MAGTTYRYKPEEDPVYQAALQAQKNKEASAPTLTGAYDKAYKDLYDQRMNQKPFAYDINGDALWQQYKDQYTQKGQMAMMDAMGQAAALTGGYGNSAAQAVGQQTYQGYMQQLTDKIPELEQMARQKYLDEQQLLRDKFDMTSQMRADEYGRYQDALGQHNIEVERARADTDKAYDRESDIYYKNLDLIREDERVAYDRQFQESQTAYNQKQDASNRLVELITTTGYTPSDAELAAAGMNRTQAAAYATYYKEQKAAAAAKASAGAKGETYKQVLDYKGIGYDSYDKFAEAMRAYAKTNGNKEMHNKLAGYVAAGMIDDATAQNLYDMFWTEEGQKVPMTPEQWKQRTGSYYGYETWLAQQQ